MHPNMIVIRHKIPLAEDARDRYPNIAVINAATARTSIRRRLCRRLHDSRAPRRLQGVNVHIVAHKYSRVVRSNIHLLTR